MWKNITGIIFLYVLDAAAADRIIFGVRKIGNVNKWKWFTVNPIFQLFTLLIVILRNLLYINSIYLLSWAIEIVIVITITITVILMIIIM